MSPTKVLLIGAEDEENLSIRYLGAVLEKQGNVIGIVPCSDYKDIANVIKAVKRFGPQLIGVSVAFQRLANMFFKLIQDIRSSGYKGHITVGGHFPTFEYKKILGTQKGIDSVIRFEGERAIRELAEACEGKKELSSVTNLVYRDSEGVKENNCIYKFQALDDLPYPLRTKKAQVRLGEKFATLVASRGCWHSSCLYCCIGAFHSKKEGNKFSLRSPENIAKEIAELYHKKDVRLFQFHDDNFMLPSKKETVERYSAIRKGLEAQKVSMDDIAFLIKARPDSIDEDVAVALKELGTVGVFLGIENASKSGLKSLIRGSALSDVYTSLELLKKYGMVATFNLLIFHPNATLDEINDNIVFIKEHLECPFDFGRAEIVAGSPLERQVIQEGLLKGSWPNWDYQIKDKAVEQLFRINQATLRRKDSNYSKLAHFLIALSYHAYTLERFYPGPVSKELLSETTNLIRRSNGFILDKMLEMYRLTAELKSKDELDALFNSTNNRCVELHKEAKQLFARMNKLQLMEKKFKKLGVNDFVQNSGALQRLLGI